MYNNTMRFVEKNHNHTKEDTAKIEEEASSSISTEEEEKEDKATTNLLTKSFN